ncbi:MAG: four-carbon acid sugar kinase family protein, partial [Lacunisphaera sp.]|nr:four-carbon acid sugar kinase family protein [Lacunisphaera sp.]
DAIGVAGLTRSLAPAEMETVLRPAFAALRTLGPRHVHYKVCSTFDSSPAVGSIGRAIDVGAESFGNRPVPLLVAAPALGRYCAFGQLYARYGIGSAGAIYRLDRHPAISRHPVTPMTEADLRVHLGQQTAKRIGLLDVLDLERPPAGSVAALAALIAAGQEVILFDGLNDSHLLRAGALIDGLAGGTPLFSVGSSGIEAALTAHWAESGRASPPDEPSSTTAQRGRFALPGPAAPLLGVSGSCSPVTAGQIDWALAHGFTGIRFEGEGSTATAVATLQSGRHVVVYTSRGEAGAPVAATVLGSQLGRLARTAVAQAGVTRLVVAGGDTSSYAGRALGIESLEMLAPLAPGAPLCRAFAPGSPADGMEINFKGGQVGAPDYFGAVARGRI